MFGHEVNGPSYASWDDGGDLNNSLSFLWFGPIGLIVTVLVGKAISFLLGNQLTSRPDLVFQRSRSQSDSPATQNHA